MCNYCCDCQETFIYLTHSQNDDCEVCENDFNNILVQIGDKKTGKILRFCNKEVRIFEKKKKFNVSIIPLEEGKDLEIIAKPVDSKVKLEAQKREKIPKIRVATKKLN